MRRFVVCLIALAALAPSTGALAQQSQQPGASGESSSQSPPSTPTAQPPPGQSGSEVEIAADSLVGSKVRNAQGQDIGSVSKLFIDTQRGTITRVIVKQGGGLGMGGKEVAVPWSAVKIQRDQQTLVVTMQQETIPQAPQQQGQDQGSGSPSASPRGDQKR